ncbi:MAG: division/cell wall cluster transcriptional repressor MraZ [Candidatus Omnitrophica bacterium]|nr:division/cell wall cluster transcriptional repressor MraZ [Candidatus Omnitrophota bacterium]
MEGSGVFYGEYLHILDNKKRLIIPSRFRDVIKDKGIEKFYITRGLEECIFMFPDSVWKTQEKKFSEMAFTRKNVRSFQRQFFGGAVDMTLDKQWRILIPDYLREYAKINKKVKMVGVSDRIEIWDVVKWEEFYANSKKDYADIAELLGEEGSIDNR